MTGTISEEAKEFAKRIEDLRKLPRNFPGQPFHTPDLIAKFNARELAMMLSTDEAALIASAIAARKISPDYIKRMRLAKRLRARKISERAYVYELRDLFFVEFRKPYTRKPPGRPKKNEFSDNGKNSSKLV